MDQLTANLLDLLFQLEGRDVPLMIGGGYGLFLKRQYLVSTGERMLFENLPASRATNDLDLFLRAELLSDIDRTRRVREAVVGLHYRPVDEAKFLQWKKEIAVHGVVQEVKIDMLVGPLGEYRSRLKVKGVRVRPKGDKRKIGFHAYLTEEAVHLEDHPIDVEVRGRRTTGEESVGSVLVPEAFPYLMMKLHAFADRKDDENKDYGRHHALDVYSIVGMMTEREYERAGRIGLEQSHNPHVRRARTIVSEDFSQETGIGILRLREHSLYRPEFQLDEFRQVLAELFRDGDNI